MVENNRSFHACSWVLFLPTADKSLSVGDRVGEGEAVFYKLGKEPFGRKIFNDRFVSLVYFFKRRNGGSAARRRVNWGKVSMKKR